MNIKYVMYIISTALIISLAVNEILFENVQSLQKNINEYTDANNQMIQKASKISVDVNKTTTSEITP